MKYYRVKPEIDQKPRIKYSRFTSHRIQDGVFIADELYTACELKKFYIPEEIFPKMFESVTIPKNKVFWNFGCRYEMKEV